MYRKARNKWMNLAITFLFASICLLYVWISQFGHKESWLLLVLLVSAMAIAINYLQLQNDLNMKLRCNIAQAMRPMLIPAVIILALVCGINIYKHEHLLAWQGLLFLLIAVVVPAILSHVFWQPESLVALEDCIGLYLKSGEDSWQRSRYQRFIRTNFDDLKSEHHYDNSFFWIKIIDCIYHSCEKNALENAEEILLLANLSVQSLNDLMVKAEKEDKFFADWIRPIIDKKLLCKQLGDWRIME